MSHKFVAALAASLILGACATPVPLSTPTAADPISPAPTKAPNANPNPATPTRVAAPATAPTAAATAAATKAGAPTPPAAALPAGERPLAKLPPAQRLNFRNTLPENTLTPGKKYVATFKITDTGNMKILLDPALAPITVNSFVYLANQGFYDGTSFHRVLKNFMAQGGDPTGTGTGGPGYKFQDEKNTRVFDRPGILAMANSGPNTNGSQFFITYAPTQHLNGLHTIFGDVVEGADVLQKIKLRDPGANPPMPSSIIERIDIAEVDAAVASSIAVPTAEAKAATCTAVPDTFGQVPKELEVAATDHVIGNPNAATTLVIYADPQCPACAKFHTVSKKLMADFPENLRMVYRHYPLTAVHDKAFTASVALEAAQEQGKFFEMMDVLFAKQSEWNNTPVTDSVKTMIEMAKATNLDIARFEKSMAKPELTARVQRDVELGDQLELNTTPSLFLDGRPIAPSAFSNAEALTSEFKPYMQLRSTYKNFLAGKPTTYAKPENVADAAALYELTLKTSKGDVVIELDPKIAPINVNSALFLAQKGWYKGSTVLMNEPQANAVVMSDASGTGLGSPGYECDLEVTKTPQNAWEEPGTVGLVSTRRSSTGAQLFITYGPSRDLAGQFTVIGKVVKGLEIVKTLQAAAGDTKADTILSAEVKKK